MKKKSLGKSALTTALVYGTMSFFGGGAIASAEESKAEEAPLEFSLDTMVVTATRTLKDLQQVPSSVSVITAQEIEEKNAMSVQEALQYVPGVYMNQAAQSGIQLRGFGSDDILVLVDGMQMNTSYNGTVNFNTLPVENIERIEVLRGAASSIYGGYAVGGVINIITKRTIPPTIMFPTVILSGRPRCIKFIVIPNFPLIGMYRIRSWSRKRRIPLKWV